MENKNKSNEFIVCPVCKKQIKVLKMHFNKSHSEIDYYKFISENKVKTCTDSFISDKSKRMTSLNYEKWFREINRETEKKRKSSGNNWKNYNNNKPIEDERKRIKSVISANKSDKKRKIMAEHGRKRFLSNPLKWSQKLNSGGISYHPEIVLPNGHKRKLRSQIEFNIISYLISLKIDFKYESVFIPYLYNGKSHAYIPDIIIGNIIIEVKPKNLRDDIKTQLKKEATEQLGYKFYFAENQSEIDSIFFEGSTTIESII